MNRISFTIAVSMVMLLAASPEITGQESRQQPAQPTQLDLEPILQIKQKADTQLHPEKPAQPLRLNPESPLQQPQESQAKHTASKNPPSGLKTQIWKNVPSDLFCNKEPYTPYDKAFIAALSAATPHKEALDKYCEITAEDAAKENELPIAYSSNAASKRAFQKEQQARNMKMKRLKSIKSDIISVKKDEYSIRFNNIFDHEYYEYVRDFYAHKDKNTLRPCAEVISSFTDFPESCKATYKDNTLQVTAPEKSLQAIDRQLHNKGESIANVFAKIPFSITPPKPGADIYMFINLNSSTIEGLTSKGTKKVKANLIKIISKIQKERNINIFILEKAKEQRNKICKSLKIDNPNFGSLNSSSSVPGGFFAEGVLAELYFPHGKHLPLLSFTKFEDGRISILSSRSVPDIKMLDTFLSTYFTEVEKCKKSYCTTTGPEK